MSRFSGKCDFYDFIAMHDFDYIKRSDVYIGYSFDNRTHKIIPGEKIEIESVQDIVPYYPHIICAADFGEDKATIYLSTQSWVDIEEEKYGQMRSHEYYRKELKREIEKYN